MPAPDSRFTYPRSIQNDVADVLASVRAMCNSTELRAVDLVTKSLIELFHEHDPTFLSRADEWARRARYRHGTPPATHQHDRRSTHG